MRAVWRAHVAHPLERVARRVDQRLARGKLDDVPADTPTALTELQAASVPSHLPASPATRTTLAATAPLRIE